MVKQLLVGSTYENRFLRFSGKSHHVAGGTRPLWPRPTFGGMSAAVWQPNQGQGSEKQPPTLPQGAHGSVGGRHQASESLFFANSDRKKGVGAPCTPHAAMWNLGNVLTHPAMGTGNSATVAVTCYIVIYYQIQCIQKYVQLFYSDKVVVFFCTIREIILDGMTVEIEDWQVQFYRVHNPLNPFYLISIEIMVSESI